MRSLLSVLDLYPILLLYLTCLYWKHFYHLLSIYYVITLCVSPNHLFYEVSVEFNNDQSKSSKHVQLTTMLSQIKGLWESSEEDIQNKEISVYKGTVLLMLLIIFLVKFLFKNLTFFSANCKLIQYFNNCSQFQLPKRKFPTFSENDRDFSICLYYQIYRNYLM